MKKLLIAIGLVAVTGNAFAAFSMEDYLKVKEAKGKPALTAPKVEAKETDFALGIAKNQARISSGNEALIHLTEDRSIRTRAVSSATYNLTSAQRRLAYAKQAYANHDKNKITTGNPKIKAAATVVEQAKFDLKTAKKKLAGMDLKIKHQRRAIAVAKQKIVLYTNKLAKQKAEAAE